MSTERRVKPWQTMSFYATVFLLLFIGTLVVASFGLKADARVWPLTVGIPVLVMLVILIIAEFNPKIESAFEVSWEGAAVEEGMEEAAQGRTRKVLVSDIPWRIVGIVFGSLVLVAVGVLVLGFLIAPPIYVVLFLRLFGGASWKGAVLLALGTEASLYALARLARLDLYPGMITGAPIPPF